MQKFFSKTYLLARVHLLDRRTDRQKTDDNHASKCSRLKKTFTNMLCSKFGIKWLLKTPSFVVRFVKSLTSNWRLVHLCTKLELFAIFYGFRFSIHERSRNSLTRRNKLHCLNETKSSARSRLSEQHR